MYRYYFIIKYFIQSWFIWTDKDRGQSVRKQKIVVTEYSANASVKRLTHFDGLIQFVRIFYSPTNLLQL